ncbi:hypothetical protein N7522_003502 [Penicillium canescens]|nr:hypothetical protein N7522_003502 [Penicillium canescens]
MSVSWLPGAPQLIKSYFIDGGGNSKWAQFYVADIVLALIAGLMRGLGIPGSHLLSLGLSDGVVSGDRR